MTRNQLLKEIRIRARITNVEAAAFYKAFVEVVAETMKDHDSVSIHQFGRFNCHRLKARQIMLFGRETRVKAGLQIRFKAAKYISAEI
ncbi:MAG: HU family DNA-binding protein [Candidatus Rifleibacteriota bacterium]